ncbi:MAG: STAS domain-containing protein [Planctomycetota bacterium]
MQFQLIRADDSVTVVALAGRLDVDGVQRLQDQFTFAIVPRGKPTVVDLTGVEFLASLGIGMLVSVARALKAQQAPLVVFGASPMVKKTITSSGVDRVIPVMGTLDEAMKLFA